jgi:disintegrin/metalloproteinase domain-containing protein 33
MICPDLYVKNGQPCVEENLQSSRTGSGPGAGSGYCFNGECPTPGKQCQDLWGHGAEPAEDECFVHYNIKGTAQGNCGENKYKYGSRSGSGDSEFKKCTRSDVMCGTLHCQGGLDKPIVDGGVTHINMQGHIQEKHVECKIMTGGMDMMAGQADLGLVRDGAKCGDNRICLNQTCKDLSTTRTYTKCPQVAPGFLGIVDYSVVPLSAQFAIHRSVLGSAEIRNV